MQVLFKQDVKIDGVLHKKGLHTLDAKLHKNWFLSALIADGTCIVKEAPKVIAKEETLEIVPGGVEDIPKEGIVEDAQPKKKKKSLK